VKSRTKKILDENPDLKRHWISLIPQGKMGQPEDLMGAVTFLSSDASGYITGTSSPRFWVDSCPGSLFYPPPPFCFLYDSY
jgi:NAD(P)-dependent dehydrogenase (short-subunit alcohol dehydrogenase family)